MTTAKQIEGFSQINKRFYNHVKDNEDKRVFIFYGGAGSGKSVFIMQWLLTNAINTTTNILILRKWREAVRESVIVPFMAVAESFGISWERHFHKTDRTLYINDSRIVFGGLDNVEKFKGTQWHYIWIEEATDVNENDYDLLDLRLGRDIETAKFIMSFNPIDANHWLIKRFINTPDEDVAIHHSTYLDNAAALSQSFIRRVEDLINKDDNLYRVYTLGEPGVLENQIYSNWSIQSAHPIEHDTPVCSGLDFGYNNPNALIDIYYRDGAIWLDERLYQSYMTNQDLIDWLKQNHNKQVPIYPDPAEPQRISEIRKAGFNVIESDKSVRDGIDFCKSQPIIITARSTNLIREIQGYRWRELKDGSVIDEPVKVNDHLCDAFRYAIYTHFGRQPGFEVPDELQFF